MELEIEQSLFQLIHAGIQVYIEVCSGKPMVCVLYWIKSIANALVVEYHKLGTRNSSVLYYFILHAISMPERFFNPPMEL